MVIPPYTYLSPTKLDEALDILAQNQSGVMPLAGGTDILVMMKEGRLKPDSLLSLKNIVPLKGIDVEEQEVKIGANTTVGELERSGVMDMNPAFGDLVRQMATRQIRNRATIGGNLCTAAACADFPPVLLVNEATVTIVNKKEERQMSLEKFFTGPRKTALKTGELLLSVHCKRHNPGTAYIKFGVRESANISIVGIACSLEVEDGKVSKIVVASTAASPIPLVIDAVSKVTLGRAPQTKTWEAAAEEVVNALHPISDLRGSLAYRFHLAKVGTLRALDTAYRRLMKNNAVEA
jgi:aerobic carbon-monoxide dehydrogenase medium subunit